MDAIFFQADEVAFGFCPQHLTNTAWSCAKLEVLNQPLMPAPAAASRPKLSEFNPQNLANTAWSFATLGYVDRTLLNAIAAAAIRIISDCEA